VKPNSLVANVRLSLVAATAIVLAPFAGAASPAPLVSASGVVETTISLALVNTHRPVSIGVDADTLAGDVNAERAKRGVAALTRDASLDEFALAKATDMALQGYFGHTSPAGVTFAQRMSAGRWPTAYVGENIAFDRDEPAAHRAFVASPGHYANLIDANERRFGVAVVTVGHGETFYVEDFSQ
jgi:uncharacterized protein YkwD